ncbi:MAG: phytoene desaturase family protein [Dehalococcoidia bacterium]|nr:phytoene desaturase family protein [Dehalococcoidia bacterium]
MKKVLIIGGGFGGLGLAIRLQVAGYQVTIVEKNERVGGRANVIRDRGYTFDTGPSILLMADTYHSLFGLAGRKLEDYVTMVRLETNYRAHFGDGSHIDLTANIARQIEEIGRFTDNPAQRYLAFLHDAAYKYRMARERFVERNFFSLAEFATPRNLLEVLKTNSLQNLYPFVGKFFDDERLKTVFTLQTVYLGISPYQAPAIYALLPYTELAEGIWYTIGGIYKMVEALERLAKELGVKIVTNCEVTAIRIDGRRAVGAMTKDGTPLTADIVVSNVDLPTTYKTLLPPAARAPYTDQKLDAMRYTCSSYLLYLGMDRQYDQLLHHNFFLTKNTKANFDEVFVQKVVPKEPSYYVHAPTRTDPTVAPEGKEALFILVPTPSGPGIDWTVEAPRLREYVLDHLSGFLGQDLRRQIVVEHEVTPSRLGAWFGLAHDAAFGLGHDFWQVGWFRPDNKAKMLDNLYFVGASTRPGTGLPMVLLSAMTTAERILLDYPVNGGSAHDSRIAVAPGVAQPSRTPIGGRRPN